LEDHQAGEEGFQQVRHAEFDGCGRVSFNDPRHRIGVSAD
jgi:hypothetical protein